MPMNTWREMAGGNRDAFLRLYQIHYNALFCYGLGLSLDRELTKDSIQELFLEIWNSRTSLNKEVANTQSYLFTWLRRKIRLESSRRLKEKQSDELMEEFEGFQSSYEEILVAFQQSEEKKEQLRQALESLTKKQLEIIRLKFFENLSYRTIAVQTSLTPRTVYNLMYQAIRHLRESMKLELAGSF
jgi:RNA polymerase sigma factor (sigma-70 family)